MDEGKDYSLGHMRAKYLDLANMTFIRENTTECAKNLDSFLDTIPPDSEAAKYITKEFDKIELMKRLQTQQLMEEIKTLGELEKTDIKNQGELMINAEALHDKKIICWNAAEKYKLNQDENETDYKP